MSLLAPLFLLGLGALALPVLIHLQRRHHAKHQDFPSLMFLHKLADPHNRRRRLRDVLLLALRLLVLTLLVFAFARPFLGTGEVAASPERRGNATVVLLDNSFSMSAGGRWQAALEAAAEAAQPGEEDRVSLIVFSDRAEERLAPTADQASYRAALESVELSSRRGDLLAAARAATKALQDSSLGSRRLVLISDFQRTGWSGEELPALPQGTEVVAIDVADAETHDRANLRITSASRQQVDQGGRDRLSLQARVSSYGGSEATDGVLIVEGDGRELARQGFTVEAGGVEIVVVEGIALPEGETPIVLRLEGDAEAFDNEFRLTVSAQQALQVGLLSGAAKGSLYLENALRFVDDPRIEAERLPDASASQLQRRAAIIFDRSGSVGGGEAAALESFVRNGGGLLVAAGERGLPRFPASSPLALTVAAGSVDASRSPRRVSTFDLDHPALEIFAQPRSGDFSGVQVFRYERVTPQEDVDRILMRFDDGSPAIVERRLGSGRMIVWVSSLDNYWNNLPLQPVFLPLLHQVLRTLGGHEPVRPWYTVADLLDLRGLAADGGAGDEEAVPTFDIREPGGGRAESGERYLPLEAAGFYELSNDDRSQLIAVNADPRESALSRLDAEEIVASLERPLDGAEGATPASDVTVTAADVERRQAIWRILLLLAFAILVVESLYSNRLRTSAAPARSQA